MSETAQPTPMGTAPATDDVDPDIRLFLQRVGAGFARHPNFGSLPLPQARAIAEEVRAPWVKGGPVMFRTEERRVGAFGTRVRIHRPTSAAALPVFIYIHGGGWTMFSLDTHDRLMREYAARAGVAVVGVDYSLSPEAKFPRAIEEIVSVVDWLRTEGDRHGLDSARIAIGGDSAGGNLSFATNLRLRDQGAPLLAGILANYAVCDHGHRPSYDRYDGPNYMLTAEEMERFWRNYVRSDADFDDPLACPLRADLRGLPPSFMVIADCDILRDENLAMAEKLKTAGIAVEARLYEGATHSFLEAVSIAPLSDRALEEASQWLRRVL